MRQELIVVRKRFHLEEIMDIDFDESGFSFKRDDSIFDYCRRHD